MKSKRIATLRYGPIRIPVSQVKQLKTEDGVALAGMWDGDRTCIFIDADLTPDRFWATLFHEMAHAAISMIGGGGQQCNGLDYPSLNERFSDAVGLAFAQNFDVLVKLREKMG